VILEIIGGTFMSGLLIYTFLDKHGTTDGSKIQRIANNCGLSVQEDGKKRTLHLLRRTHHSWGSEYVFRIPLGLSFEDIQKKKQHIEDGLNHKRGFLDFTLDDLKILKLSGNLLEQSKQLLNVTKQRKEILMDYDGALRIRVYRQPMSELLPFDEFTLEKCIG
jgi:hypothetical protein